MSKAMAMQRPPKTTPRVYVHMKDQNKKTVSATVYGKTLEEVLRRVLSIKK